MVAGSEALFDIAKNAENPSVLSWMVFVRPE
jgi:hypothetical protein